MQFRKNIQVFETGNTSTTVWQHNHVFAHPDVLCVSDSLGPGCVPGMSAFVLVSVSSTTWRLLVVCARLRLHLVLVLGPVRCLPLLLSASGNLWCVLSWFHAVCA